MDYERLCFERENGGSSANSLLFASTLCVRARVRRLFLWVVRIAVGGRYHGVVDGEERGGAVTDLKDEPTNGLILRRNWSLLWV